MKYSELNYNLTNALNGGGLAPGYVIGGSDAYLRRSAMNAFKGLVNPEYSDFNLTYVPSDDGLTAALDALMLFPVFDERKVVIIPDADDKLNNGEKTALFAYLNSPNPASVLVLVCEGGKAASFAKSICLEYVNCDKLDENEIAIEVDKILSTPPVRTIAKGGIHALAMRTKSDMSRIARETEKLKMYSDGEITVKDIEDMVAPDLDYATYALASAVSLKQADEALAVLDGFAKQGVEPSAVIVWLYDRYRKMLHAELHKGDDNALMTFLEVSSGELFHLKKVSKNYTQVRLKKSVDYLHNLQYSIRTGKRTDTTALHEAVLTLLNL